MQYSVVWYSEVRSIESFRYDSDFFDPKVLFYDKKIKEIGFVKFGQLIELLTDYTSNSSFAGLKENVSVQDEEEFAKWVRIQNLDQNEYLKNMRYVDKKSYEFLKKTKLSGNELLISKTGEYLGRGYIFRPTDKDTRYTLADNIFLIRLKNNNLNNFIYIWINSKIGRHLLLRWCQGTGQPTIIKDGIRDFPIPTFKQNLQNVISNLANKSFGLSAESKSLYQQAENLLLEELGLKDWKPKHQLTYIKNYSDTQKAERFDAEYFQPQYDAIIEKIKSYNQKQGINKEIILDDVVKWSKGVEVGSEQYLDEGFDFIRISDFSTKGIGETSKKISKELFAELKGKYSPRKGDILFTKDGTIGLTYLVDQNQDSIVSGAFLKLRPKIEIEAEFLTLVLNSVICKKQIEMMSGGAIIAHLKPSDAMNLQIPLLSPESQKQISSKIIESKKNNEQSKSLLEIAKKAVEMAIEDNEEKATNWIDQELEKLGVRLGKD
jgi:type I restriction enzyme S subunit